MDTAANWLRLVAHAAIQDRYGIRLTMSRLPSVWLERIARHSL
jgi:hypothetical protein